MCALLCTTLQHGLTFLQNPSMTANLWIFYYEEGRCNIAMRTMHPSPFMLWWPRPQPVGEELGGLFLPPVERSTPVGSGRATDLSRCQALRPLDSGLIVLDTDSSRTLLSLTAVGIPGAPSAASWSGVGSCNLLLPFTSCRPCSRWWLPNDVLSTSSAPHWSHGFLSNTTQSHKLKLFSPH